MCYEARAFTAPKIKYVEQYGERLLDADKLLRRLEGVTPMYYASGFDHPDLPVITSYSDELQMFGWGLIPHWVNNSEGVVQIQNQTLNARAESIFEKPSFKDSVLKRRCLVILDGFFEYHHKNGKAFPYHIVRKDGLPMSLAGVWDTWQGEGMERKTVSIVTTRANHLMTRIHNNPKTSDGPRMPVILPREHETEWLRLDADDQEELKELLVPMDDELLEAYTVPRLKGKRSVGNTAAAISKHFYPELTTVQTGLF
ncbi:MAG: SOS response-associated peptidase [Cyclobacteriaceae bacterium]